MAGDVRIGVYELLDLGLHAGQVCAGAAALLSPAAVSRVGVWLVRSLRCHSLQLP